MSRELDRMKELIPVLNEAAKAYYAEGRELMPNKEYDALYDELAALESIQAQQRVMIAGPGTFSALLSSLAMGFRTLAIEKRSGEVWRLLGEIKTDFAHFSDMLEATRRRLDQAGESIDSAVNRTRSIRRKLSDVETEGLDFPPESLTMKEEQ